MSGGGQVNEFEKQMLAGEVYMGMEKRQKRLAFALQGIEAMRRLAPRSYASISFGKQSICLAHMLYQVEPDMPMYFLASSETWDLHNYAEVIDAFLERWPINLHIVQTDHAGTHPDLSWKEVRDLGDQDLQNMVDRAEWDGWYWGLSKEESKARKITLSRRWEGQPHPTIYRYKDGKYRCCPLMHWELLDIAAYVVEHDLPLLQIYKDLGLQERTTARLTKKAVEYHGLAQVKRRDIASYNRLAARFPELRKYT
ncbi:MAG: hypothetical protein D6706_18475 [Chloroflexi bacterium]|nr:MAG: hypothetical protein D6706_18475 [Chloroflexota bacterium]